MKKLIIFLLGVVFCHFLNAQQPIENVANVGFYTLQIDKPAQYIWGLGVEIQSDAIGSGNFGLPEDYTSVPHDLTKKERDRFYADMLKGFRYCRLAGGLYFRGTTADKKELRSRWTSQLPEIREMINKAGIEGISLEYWSPTPYWKANGAYFGEKNGKQNILRCYGRDFKNDSVYHGDTLRFLNDFGESMARDVIYFENNGIKVSMWGLQNEPFGNASYSSCYYSHDQYAQTFNVVAPKIKAANPSTLIMADSDEGPRTYAKKINEDPDKRRFVNAWVWHQIGFDSNTLIENQQKYTENTHGIPVFQNEYEYLTGGTSPKRCLNTVQNIMNWFSFVNSPTWFWLHALKPSTNAEASGYALGFWKPTNAKKVQKIIEKEDVVGAGAPRTVYGYEVTKISNIFIGENGLSVERGDMTKPGKGYSFEINTKSEVYIAVEKVGDYVPPTDWVKTDLTLKWDKEDVIYKKTFEAGVVEIPEHTGKNAESVYGIPHFTIIKPLGNGLKVVTPKDKGIFMIQTIEVRKTIDFTKLKPGHWTYNDYNWNAMAGFLKHMPWNSQRFEVHEDVVRNDQRILSYKTPEGKMVFVLTNRGENPFTFNINIGTPKSFKGYRYTPEDAGNDNMGTLLADKSGEMLQSTLAPLSWEFWVEN